MTNIRRFLTVLITAAILLFIFNGCQNNSSEKDREARERDANGGREESEAYDGPDKAAEFEFKRTMDPTLGYVPTERLLAAEEDARSSKINSSAFISGYGAWEERGPISDVVGAGSGNTRANSGIASGRVRAILVDAADATGKTVFVAGVNGGLWKTTDITTAPANWVLVNDFLSNMAITDICQDPTNNNTMYFCTGEAYYNGDAVRGAGVFKSTNHGITWTKLSSASAYTYCTRILCDATGKVYLGTRSNGLKRSTDGGSTWTTITPTGMVTDICDLELSSTGRLHVVGGIFSTQSYRYTDIPGTVTSGAGWTAPTTAFPSYAMRAEIGVSGNTLYACPADASYQVPTIYKSTDGGANWVSTGGVPSATWASGQGWYALSVVVNPADPTQCIIGGLDNYKSTNSGLTWTKISTWVGTVGQYVHADQQKAVWYDNGNKLIFGCDGGVHFSSDGGTTTRDRNAGLRIKQLYSCAAHPTNLNYFLAGAQDNGSHAFSTAGLGSTTEVTGGDGAFVHIDQNEPQYQFTSYLYNQYYRSSNSGASWTGVTLSSTLGQFINPTDYDDVANIMYCSDDVGNYRRWTNPQTGNTSAVVSITALNGNNVMALTVSPYTSNRVYMGTDNMGLGTRVIYVDAANSIASGSAGTNITSNLPTNADVSCIATGTNDNNLLVTFSNYGIQQVWVSTNGGSTWTNIDGNLPDMPIRWGMFAPGDNSKIILATEAGVWITQAVNSSSTVWFASATFPTVRTDMLQYRPLDGMIVAATHGRGLWTQTATSVLPLNNFTLRGRWSGNAADLNWNYEDLPAGSVFEIESATDGLHYSKIGTVARTAGSSYSFKYNPEAASALYYRIKGIENTGHVKYSNVVRLSRSNGSAGSLDIINLYPNPVKDNLSFTYNVSAAGKATFMITSAAGTTVWSKQENVSFTGNYSNTENISILRPGNYVLTIMLNGKKVSKAFIKQ